MKPPSASYVNLSMHPHILKSFGDLPIPGGN
jgi:hypothetical protein